MDAFYAAVEQRDHSELRGRPVIVGGGSVRGVVAACSYEARVFGVRSAMPAVQARKLCPDAVFVRGDMAKYRRIGAQVRRLFEEVSPLVEPLSIDEAFIDATGSVALLGPPRTIAERLRARVRAETGLAVSVGIGPGKMVAKIASDLAKPDGLLEVPAAAVAAFLGPLPVARLFGVGAVMQAALARAGIATIGDLARADAVRLAARIGPMAEALVALARGDDTRVVEADRAAKSYGEEGTFERDVRDDRLARGAIIAHAEAVARRLRHDGVRAGTVVLKVKLATPLGGGRFPLFTRQTALDEPSDDGKVLSDAALALWTRHRPHEAVRLLGVTGAGIVGAVSAGQLGLFPDPTRRRRAALNGALDRLADRFGAHSVTRADAHAPKATPTGQVKRGEDE
ncbi:MAG: DNA polymerase IV [bacterium]|nr:DNA polymerase IV [bacterium]